MHSLHWFYTKRLRRLLAVAGARAQRRLLRSPSPRILVERLGIITTCITVMLPPIIYAVVSTHHLRERAAEHAAVGALLFSLELAREGARGQSNQSAVEFLHSSRSSSAIVTASWLTDTNDMVAMSAGEHARWPELRARNPIRSRAFNGYFNVAVSTREIFIGTLYVAVSVLLLGLGAYFCFRRLPLAALDNALRNVEAKQSQLEQQNLRFEAALENMTQGLCLFDSRQRVVVANRRYAEMYSLTAEQIKPGTTLKEILEARTAKGFYANVDSETFLRLGIAEFQQEVSQILKLADGRAISVRRRPIADGGLISTHEDITERESLNARLEEQHFKLDAALANMWQGLAMFGPDERIIIANDRFAEMYGQTLDQVKPGTPLRDIIAHRIASGLYRGTTVDEVVDRMRARVARMKESHMTSQMGDGRTITVSIQPRPDGGWVTTHQDISEREGLKNRLDAALSHMAQGLAMFDAEQRLVLCNSRFAAMYCLAPEQVEPGTNVRQILSHCVANGCYVGRDPDDLLAATMKHLGSKAMGYYTTKLSGGQSYGVSVMPMAGGGIVTTHEDITERRRIEARIAHLAHHDALTNLANRVLLLAHLEEVADRGWPRRAGRGRPLPRPRSLQGSQRHAWSFRRRSVAQSGGRPFAYVRGGGRVCRAYWGR